MGLVRNKIFVVVAERNLSALESVFVRVYPEVKSETFSSGYYKTTIAIVTECYSV